MDLFENLSEVQMEAVRTVDEDLEILPAQVREKQA